MSPSQRILVSFNKATGERFAGSVRLERELARISDGLDCITEDSAVAKTEEMVKIVADRRILDRLMIQGDGRVAFGMQIAFKLLGRV